MLPRIGSMALLSTLALLTAANLHGTGQAGKYNKVLEVGQAAPKWKDLEGIDGKKHSADELKGHDAVVVIFTCNSCPVAEDYEDRIVDFAKKHAGSDSKVAVVAINVNTIVDDQLPAMKKRAEKKKFTFPYLYDPSQKIAKEFGANYTPEFFVIDKDWKLVYMGAMDDRSPPAKPAKFFLEEAVSAALKGESPETNETLGRGCRIRFKRVRDIEDDDDCR